LALRSVSTIGAQKGIQDAHWINGLNIPEFRLACGIMNSSSEDYQELARQAEAEAEAATLPNVRTKALEAAARFRQLALQVGLLEKGRAERALWTQPLAEPPGDQA
jgi:hypothetical protein